MSERRSVLQANLESVNERIQAAWRARGSGDAPTLVVVTKNFPASDAQLLYELGVRDCGENRDEEGSEKSALLPPDITWHFQGQIQGRKIASYIHSTSSHMQRNSPPWPIGWSYRSFSCK